MVIAYVPIKIREKEMTVEGWLNIEHARIIVEKRAIAAQIDYSEVPVSVVSIDEKDILTMDNMTVVADKWTVIREIPQTEFMSEEFVL